MDQPSRPPAVFFDRDGTLMTDVDYCGDPAHVRVFPGVPETLARLRERGFRLVLITNQSGLSRGYFTADDFARVQAEFFRQLGAAGALDAVYHCSDLPDQASDRRKPAPGMVLEAGRDLKLDLTRSYFLGDSWADMECGRRAGLAGSVLVLTGKGVGELARCQPDFVATDLTQAAKWILEQTDNKHG